MAVLILNSGRCSHGRCFFCGYGRIWGGEPTAENVTACFKRFFDVLDEGEVKVYGSGSFLDERQVPATSRKYFIRECMERGVATVTVESRPEYVNKGVLAEFRGLDLTVAMGLESSDEGLLDRLGKGYGLREYEAAAKLIHEAGFKARTYLLVNPPFVGDVKGSLDESVEYALEHSESVVLINTLPHANAPLMRMWVAGEWNFLDRDTFRQVTGKWTGDQRVELDEETFRFTPTFSDDIKEELAGVGEWYLTHPHYEVWHDYIIRWYRPPPHRILLFLPCSYRKPYSKSMTHQGIIGALGSERSRFHEVMLSSAGVIPREFEGRYPFNSYDWSERQETAAIKERYIDVTAERIRNYLTAHGKYYLKAACYLRYDSESYQAVAAACGGAGMECPNLLKKDTYERVRGEKRPLQTQEALDDLREGVKWCLRNST
jgi:archaeosine synthase